MPTDPLILVVANFCVAAGLRAIKPNLATACILALVAIGVTGYVGMECGDTVLAWVSRGRDQVLAVTGPDWPPQRGRSFPAQRFFDCDHQPKRIADFRGKVVLLHVVGVSSRTSVAFAGGATYGPFQGVLPQQGLDAISNYAWTYGNVRLDDPSLVVVHLILFDHDMLAPSEALAKNWTSHFNIDERGNEFVLRGDSALVTADSRAMIPGFVLIDQKSMVRASATGSRPENDLYRDLLPMIGTLLEE